MEEGLYIVTFGHPGVPGFYSRGVVVLETNRFYGGDSFYYYTGRYEAKGEEFTAEGNVVVHTPGIMTIFGNPAPVQPIQISGTFRNGKLSATMRQKATPIPTVGVELEFREKLP
ncbi:MAG: hypothetical protein WCB99_06505 [Candidatus Cybelea sp.]